MKKLAILALLVITIAACGMPGRGEFNKQTFQGRDIKDEFCGPHINFQYCKCAFHGQLCEEVGMNRATAKAHVNAEFAKWLKTEIAAFGVSCKASGNIFYDKGEDSICVECDKASGFKTNKAGTLCVHSDINKERATCEEYIECIIVDTCTPVQLLNCPKDYKPISWGEICEKLEAKGVLFLPWEEWCIPK